jgi:hypothetical protein
MSEVIVIEDRPPFRIEIEYLRDDGWDFSHYGEFCELPRSVHGQFDHSTQARNDPKGGDFYIRNPQVWRKEGTGNGTPSWLRVNNRSHGWFKLAEHPRHEVEWLIENEGLSERDAWQKVLTRRDKTIEKLASGDLYALAIMVRVYWHDEMVGDATLGGVETDVYDSEDIVRSLAAENGMIDEALGYAQKHIENVCKTAMLADRPEGR